METMFFRKSFFKGLSFCRELCVDMLFPKYCINCGKIMPPGKTLCVCDKCALAVADMNCIFTDNNSGCDEIVSALKYDGKIREAMLKFKFKDIKYLGYTFGSLLADAVRGRAFLENAALITAVPIHVDRDREYNQSEVIARCMCSQLGLEYSSGIIYRVKPIQRLSGMTSDDKEYFIKNSYLFNPLVNLTNKTVVIIDDVYTTGTTLREISKEFRKHGAKQVYALTACYSKIQ